MPVARRRSQPWRSQIPTRPQSSLCRATTGRSNFNFRVGRRNFEPILNGFTICACLLIEDELPTIRFIVNGLGAAAGSYFCAEVNCSNYRCRFPNLHVAEIA